MHEVDSDITKFNTRVGHCINKLNANDHTCEDLLAHLFKGHQTATDETFVKCIQVKEDDWEDGAIITIEAAALMRLAEEEHKTMKLKKLWNGTTKEDANIIALKAELQEMTELVALRAEVAFLKNDMEKKHGRKKRDIGEWAWKNVTPTGSQPKEKTFKGKLCVHRMFHGNTKWVLKLNHVDGCRNNFNCCTKGKVDESKKQPQPDKKTLQHAKALMNAMEVPDKEI
jgi:hypothetical protein